MERHGDNFIYFVDMKGHGKAMVTPCIEGNTVYVDVNLPREEQIKNYYKEVDHIEGEHFNLDSANEAENLAHGKTPRRVSSESV